MRTQRRGDDSMVLSKHLSGSGVPPVYIDPGPGAPVTSVKPVVLRSAARGGENLEVKVSAPVTGDRLPVVLFSHGYGSSLDGYGPLADYWAAHGFVVVQPTYLDSRTVGVPSGDPRVREFWRSRILDARQVLDELDVILAAVPDLPQRVDRSRIAAAGHSFGGQTTGLLLGVRVLPPAGDEEDYSDPRISAGILLATAGAGGDSLSDFSKENMPHLDVDFSRMTTRALVVAGDKDEVVTALTVRGVDWCEDPYRLSPGGDELFVVHNGEHSLGGIPGYEAAEATDEDRPRLAAVQQMTWAYLRSALGEDEQAWPAAVAALRASDEPLGRVESK